MVLSADLLKGHGAQFAQHLLTQCGLCYLLTQTTVWTGFFYRLQLTLLRNCLSHDVK